MMVWGGDNSRLLAAKETNEKKSASICTNNPVSVSSLHLHTHTQCIQKALREYVCVCVCEHVQEVNKKHKKQSKLQYSKKKKEATLFCCCK